MTGKTSPITREYQKNTQASRNLNQEAQEYLPGGDSRSTIYYQPYPQFFVRGEGCWLYDADGNRFLDFTGNHTSLILGYGHPAVKQALRDQLDLGTCFPGPTASQTRLAQMIRERTPSVERVRFTSSGTEATMNAIRAARSFTGKGKVIKAEGAFHGTTDIMEISISPDPDRAGPQDRPFAVPHVEGISSGVFDDVEIIPFNNPDAAQDIITDHGDDLAAVIVEPVMGSAGMIPATKEYLTALRECTASIESLLIFDEVITYRLASGGAQESAPISRNASESESDCSASFTGHSTCSHVQPIAPACAANTGHATASNSPARQTACRAAAFRRTRQATLHVTLSTNVTCNPIVTATAATSSPDNHASMFMIVPPPV